MNFAPPTFVDFVRPTTCVSALVELVLVVALVGLKSVKTGK